jgi:hypothetical protein
MIRLQEIRIGNLLTPPDGTLVYVDEITRNIIKCKSFNGVDYWMDSTHDWSIPLNDEWLYTFGFERFGEPHEIFKRHAFVVKILHTRLILETSPFEFEIKSVHQLQNLHFDLVGEDLAYTRDIMP